MLNNGKAKIEKSYEGLTIVIPSKKNWFVLLFGTAWMGGWVFGFLSASGFLFSGDIDNMGANSFIAFWLVAWTIGGLAIATLLLWGYFGQEKFISDQHEVRFEKAVFGIGIKKRLDASSVKNFRFEYRDESFFGGNRWSAWGMGPGKIKFDYGFKTYSFGLGVDDAEAHYIVKLLKEQFKET